MSPMLISKFGMSFSLRSSRVFTYVFAASVLENRKSPIRARESSDRSMRKTVLGRMAGIRSGGSSSSG